MEGSVKSRISCYALRLVSFVFVSMLRSKIDHEDAIFNFPISKEQWDSLQTAKVVVSFMHQKNLEIVLPRK